MGKASKKLHWKQFRFLSKTDIKNSNDFLTHLFDELKIDWYRNFDFLISSILSPKIKSNGFDFGYYYIYLGNMIETAFCIYVKLHPDKNLKDLREKQLNQHFGLSTFYDSGLDDDEKSELAGHYCETFLNEFFEYKTLRKWYVEMEQLLFLAFDPAVKDSFIVDLEKHLISKQFLTNLPKILHLAHQYKVLKGLN